MSDNGLYRMERIERLLHELRYEVERGMLEREIDETLSFNFYVPLSTSIPGGVVHCRFETRPLPRIYMSPEDIEPRLKLVKS